MREYINLTLDNIESEHICCAINDAKHQNGVIAKKEWIKKKLKEGHVFRKLKARGKIFIEYEPLETAWVPIIGKNYEYIYCLWVSGSFKKQGIAKDLLQYAINDAKENGAKFIHTYMGMTLRANQRDYYFKKLDQNFPGLKQKYLQYYGYRYTCPVPNYQRLSKIFQEECKKYQILYNMQDIIKYYKKEHPNPEQMTLF